MITGRAGFDEIYKMMCEELMPCFQGTGSFDDAISVLNSRIWIYLAE